MTDQEINAKVKEILGLICDYANARIRSVLYGDHNYPDSDVMEALHKIEEQAFYKARDAIKAAIVADKQQTKTPDDAECPNCNGTT